VAGKVYIVADELKAIAGGLSVLFLVCAALQVRALRKLSPG